MKQLILIILLFLISCGSDSGNKKSYADFVEEGWSEFETKKYTEAIERFQKAVDKDDSKSEAYMGIGWSNLKLNELALSSSNFTSAISKTDATADSYSGSAFILNAQKNYESSNSSILNAINENSSWSIAHGLSLAINDIYALSAQNYFLLGDFSKSLEMIQNIDASFQTDITSYSGRLSLTQKIEFYNKFSL